MSNSIYLRQAEIKDARFLWELRNDKNIRKNFFDSSSISYNKHLNWFKHKLFSLDAYIFIIKNKRNEKIGYVRFERKKNNTWKISIAVLPKFQCKGYGSRAIIMGCRRLFKMVGVKKIVAYILNDNVASLNAFQMAGFTFRNNRKIKQRDAVILKKILSNE